MNEQSKFLNVLYAVFLTVITINTCVSLYDRFSIKEDHKKKKTDDHYL